MKHLFNNTRISDCFRNGCPDCAIHDVFAEEYRLVCKSLVFADGIQSAARQYIRSHFGDAPFVSFHLRYPDQMQPFETLSDFVDYDERCILSAMEAVCCLHSVPATNIFVATNNKAAFVRSPLASKYVLAQQSDIDTFVEQCICICSLVFVFSRFNDYRKVASAHQRSTWASFVVDYRKIVCENSRNILLDEARKIASCT